VKQTTMLISGITKVMIKELVDLSHQVQADWGVTKGSAIAPKELREAWVRYRKNRRSTSKVPLVKRLF
jgi:ribosomal protein L7/L12